jgi:hypothetical protein
MEWLPLVFQRLCPFVVSDLPVRGVPLKFENMKYLLLPFL